MLNKQIFHLITRLMNSRWARHDDEQHSPYEDACTAVLGPFRLDANYWAGWSVWWQRPFPATSPTPADKEIPL